jgi:hypothetical protein
VSWQALAPALGVASRQAAERRYLRLIPAITDQPGSTRDGRSAPNGIAGPDVARSPNGPTTTPPTCGAWPAR